MGLVGECDVRWFGLVCGRCCVVVGVRECDNDGRVAAELGDGAGHGLACGCSESECVIAAGGDDVGESLVVSIGCGAGFDFLKELSEFGVSGDFVGADEVVGIIKKRTVVKRVGRSCVPVFVFQGVEVTPSWSWQSVVIGAFDLGSVV